MNAVETATAVAANSTAPNAVVIHVAMNAVLC